jgi:hypothetical protein
LEPGEWNFQILAIQSYNRAPTVVPNHDNLDLRHGLPSQFASALPADTQQAVANR